MTTTAEHLNYSPGLADGICPAHCGHLARIFGAAHCVAFDRTLTQDENRNARRCKACKNHGVNHDHHED
jgi:hypothetical protein